MMQSVKHRKTPRRSLARPKPNTILTSQLIGTEPLKDKVEEPEVNDGDFELIRKIRSIAGLGYDALHGEHAYNRYKGASDLSVPLPTRRLFYAYDTESSDPVRDEDVDIDTVDEEEPLVDTAVANRLLDECEKLIEIYRPRNPDKADAEDTWEENITKSNWSASHFKAFGQLTRLLAMDHMARLSHVGHSSEAILRRVTIEQTAARIRKLFTSVGWNMKTAQWLHALLVDRAPGKVLVCYLEAMQVLHAKIPALVNQVINPSGVSIASKNLGLDIITQIITKKSWDPVAPMLSQHKMPKLPLAPVFIVLGSEPLHDLPQNSRTHHWISLLTELGSVIPITSLQTEQEKSKMKIATYLDELLYTVRYRIHQTRTEFEAARRPIILVGVNAGSALMAHASLYESVAGVLCLGFSVDTVEGRRGRPGDRLLEMRCPVLFVIGQCATTASEQDMEQLRLRLKCISGLIVVGGGDDQMRKSKLDLMQEKVTQDIVDRAVINEVGAWLSKALTMPKPTPPPRPSLQAAPPTVAPGTEETTAAAAVVPPTPKVKLTKEEKAAKREAKEKEKATKKNYYQERKRKLAEMKANNVDISPNKKQKMYPAGGPTSKNPQIIMVSTAPTILRTSTSTQFAKIKKSDLSPRKQQGELISPPSPGSASMPQITIVSPAKPSPVQQTRLPPPLTTMSPIMRLAPLRPSTPKQLPQTKTLIRVPASTSSLPNKPLPSPQQQIPPPLQKQTIISSPAAVSSVPREVNSSLPVTSSVQTSSSVTASTGTPKTPSTGKGYISLQSLLKSHQGSRPVPLSQTAKKLTPAGVNPASAPMITSVKPQNIRVFVKDNRPRTFNLSSLTKFKYLTTSPSSGSSSLPSPANLLRDLTPAQLLDAPIDIVGPNDDEVIPIESSTATPQKPNVKLIRINKSGINVSSGAPPKKFTFTGVQSYK